jgi:hypothetical protein
MNTPRHQFNYVCGDDTVCITTTAETLSELVEKFEDYLKACGFHFEGRQLDFVTEGSVPDGTDPDHDANADGTHTVAWKPYPATGYVPPVTDDLTPSEDKETST